MKQYDVCPLKAASPKSDARLVVVLQHAHMNDLATVLVAPLYLASELPAIKRLRPEVRLGRRNYVVAVDRLAAVPTKQIGGSVASLETRCHELSNALDLLFAGF
jgi:mRNA-degrading endonuclease toxin of MazEF toxin-antitoxin module